MMKYNQSCKEIFAYKINAKLLDRKDIDYYFDISTSSKTIIEKKPNWTITFLPINTKKHFISLYVNDINVVWLR